MKLVYTFWLLLFGSILAFAVPNSESQPPTPTFGYDERVQASIASDRTFPSAFLYDSVSAFLANEKENRTPGTDGFLARFAEFVAAKTGVHKNSLEYIGDTHVYRIKGPDGTTFKIGESARGVRAGDGLSIRAEEQVRRLGRENGPGFESEIRKTFGSKAEARDYERRLIERFRRMYGEDALPGNKSYH